MTREIKFRAWDKDAERVIYPNEDNGEGYPIEFVVYKDGIKVESYADGGNWTIDGGEPTEHGGTCEHDAVIMQYTGLKDKLGVEIYEGDIVRQELGYHWWLYLVRTDEQEDSQFGNQLFSWTIKDNFAENEENPDYYSYRERILDRPARKYVRSGKDCEVIGNIWENPELLEEQA